MTGLLQEVADYYSAKLAQHGPTPQGVDWNSEESQLLRFTQLSKIIEGNGFSFTDIGCGYGAMLHYLMQHFLDFTYTGIDVSPAMIATAQQQHAATARATFSVASIPPATTDYCIASGIFNVRQQRNGDEWHDYILRTLDGMAAHSRRGFAANFLPSYADADKKRDYLYYAEPDALTQHCAQYGEVTLLRDYGLYEFTLLVRTA